MDLFTCGCGENLSFCKDAVTTLALKFEGLFYLGLSYDENIFAKIHAPKCSVLSFSSSQPVLQLMMFGL